MARRPAALALVALALVALVAALLVVTRGAAPPAPPATGASAAPRADVGDAGPLVTAAARPGAPDDAAGHVEGVVVDELTGAPLPGVEVVCTPRAAAAPVTTRADAAGRFAVDLAAGDWQLSARGDGLVAPPAPAVSVGAGVRVTSFVLRARRVATVTGRVVDGAGEPLAGATVEFTTRRPDRSLDNRTLDPPVTTGEDGGFTTRVWPGEVLLVARLGGDAGELRLPLVEAGAALAGAEIVIDAQPALAGVVRDRSGRPVPGATVEAYTDGPTFTNREATAAGADGRFALAALPPGRVLLVARAPGFAASAPLAFEREAPPAGEVVLVLRDALAITGRVVRPDGSPAAGASVAARRAGSPLPDAATATTDGEGGFRLGGLDPGPWQVAAYLPGFGGTLRDGVGAPQDGVELRLTAAGGLAGRVTDEAGVPVADLTLRWRQVATGHIEARHLLAADGAFRVEGLPPGVYELWIAAPGYAPVSLRVNAPPGAYGDASAVLGRGAVIAGVVRSRDGAPVAGARVDAMTGQAGEAVLTGTDGRYTLTGVAPGRRSLSVEHPGFVTRSESGVEVRAGERAVVDVTLTPLAPGQPSGARPVEFAGIGAVLVSRDDLVVLAQVVPGGPAERVGLRPGDAVISIDGRPTAGRALGDIIEDIRGVAGTSVRLEVRRGGDTRLIDVVRGTVRFGG